MSRISHRDPSTGEYAPLRSPALAIPSHRERIEARARAEAAQNDQAIDDVPGIAGESPPAADSADQGGAGLVFWGFAAVWLIVIIALFHGCHGA